MYTVTWVRVYIIGNSIYEIFLMNMNNLLTKVVIFVV